MTEDDLRWAVRQFREWRRPGESEPLIKNLHVSTWWREPDYSEDYRRLYDLEAELSDGDPVRHELLSVWRLARDPGYAQWAKEVGPDTCQITFFGMDETQDWFHRRSGAFRDSIAATDRLLDAGMKPRWQFFLTKKILPDIDDLMRLVDRVRLRERVSELGGEFAMFIHAPTLDGEAMDLYDISAAIEDTKLIPADLVEGTKRHFKTDKIWTTEAEAFAAIAEGLDDMRYQPGSDASGLWFLVMSTWDVFTNLGSTKPWWKVGNLKKEGVAGIVDRLENDRVPAFRTTTTVPLQARARRFGNPASRRVVNEIEAFWLERWCAVEYDND